MDFCPWQLYYRYFYTQQGGGFRAYNQQCRKIRYIYQTLTVMLLRVTLRRLEHLLQLYSPFQFSLMLTLFLAPQTQAREQASILSIWEATSSQYSWGGVDQGSGMCIVQRVIVLSCSRYSLLGKAQEDWRGVRMSEWVHWLSRKGRDRGRTVTVRMVTDCVQELVCNSRTISLLGHCWRRAMVLYLRVCCCMRRLRLMECSESDQFTDGLEKSSSLLLSLSLSWLTQRNCFFALKEVFFGLRSMFKLANSAVSSSYSREARRTNDGLQRGSSSFYPLLSMYAVLSSSRSSFWDWSVSISEGGGGLFRLV